MDTTSYIVMIVLVGGTGWLLWALAQPLLHSTDKKKMSGKTHSSQS